MSVFHWGAGKREKCDLQVFVGFTCFNISHVLQRQRNWNVSPWLHTEGPDRASMHSSDGAAS